MRRRAQRGMGGRTKGDAKEEEANILLDALLHIVLCVPLPLPLSRWQPNMIGSHLRNSPFLHRHAVCSPPINNFSPKFTEPLNRRCMQQLRTTVVDLLHRPHSHLLCMLGPSPFPHHILVGCSKNFIAVRSVIYPTKAYSNQ